MTDQADFNTWAAQVSEELSRQGAGPMPLDPEAWQQARDEGLSPSATATRIIAESEYDEAFNRHLATLQDSREERQESESEVDEDEESDEEVAHQLAESEMHEKHRAAGSEIRATLPQDVSTEVKRMAQEQGITEGEVISQALRTEVTNLRFGRDESDSTTR